MPTKKPNATREFRTTASTRSGKKSSGVQTSAAYRTARIARARQKRELEQQKREKLMFAMFIVTILVLLLVAILVFKSVIGGKPDDTLPYEASHGEDTHDTGGTASISTPEGTTVTVEKNAVTSGSLVLTDESHPYFSSVNTLNMSQSRTVFGTSSSGKNIYSYYVISTSDTACEKAALNAFNSFADGFYTATKNVDLFVSNAYAVGNGAHSAGLAFDLKFWTGGNSYYAMTDEKYKSDFEWINDNAHKYGFVVNSDCDADFCLRYVGVPHAYYMHRHDLTLKEYLDKVCKETLAFTADSGDKYEVYYVHVTGDMVSVPIYSSDAEYQISGDNAEGIIVTVKMN